jgi:hypothetical protein
VCEYRRAANRAGRKVCHFGCDSFFSRLEETRDAKATERDPARSLPTLACKGFLQALQLLYSTPVCTLSERKANWPECSAGKIPQPMSSSSRVNSIKVDCAVCNSECVSLELVHLARARGSNPTHLCYVVITVLQILFLHSSHYVSVWMSRGEATSRMQQRMQFSDDGPMGSDWLSSLLLSKQQTYTTYCFEACCSCSSSNIEPKPMQILRTSAHCH